MMTTILFGLMPVTIFLILLNTMDSYKLLKMRVVSTLILWGSISAAIAYPVNNYFLSQFGINFVSVITAPITEETLKIAIVAFLFYKNKLAFLADAFIIGFASGTGFSIIENIFYFSQLESQNVISWVVRGFGTAMMHGTATAVASVVIQILVTKREKMKFHYLLVGLAAGFLIHAVFNNYYLPPLIQTVLQFSLLPFVVFQIFSVSEKVLRKWMEEESHTEFETLRMIKAGEFKSTRTGRYILSIKNRFDPVVIFDMLAYIQLYLELSIKAKGLLMMREAGFESETNDDIKPKLEELQFLSKSIGKTGMKILSPIIKKSNKDLWKLNLLK